MKWRGETEGQVRARIAEWHRVFCWFPRQMRNGTWVWLEHCWCKAEPNCRGGYFFSFSDSLTKPEEVRSPTPLKPSKK